MKNPKIVCLGEALVDRLGPFGGDPRTDQPIQDCLGGAPANVACGLAKLGKDVAFIGCLGQDEIGNKFKECFKSRDVNIVALQTHKDIPTRVVLVKRDMNGERTFGGFEGNQKKIFADQVLDVEKIKDLWFPLVDKANWLVLGTIPLAAEASKQSLLWCIEKAYEKNIDIALDVNWRPTFWDENLSSDASPSSLAVSLIHPLLERASLIKLAKEEAIWFFNDFDPRSISLSLPQKPSVIVTDGAGPIRWLLGEFYGEFNALPPKKVVDTTGAGDSFTAGLISQILETSLLPTNFLQAEQIVRFAAACGALVCSAPGAIAPQPTYSEVIEFLS